MNYGGIGYILFNFFLIFGGLIAFRKELEVEIKTDLSAATEKALRKQIM